MLTDRQQHLIKQAKELGFGYSIFAANIDRQGFCSQKQEDSLSNMVSAGDYRKNNWKPNCKGSNQQGYTPDISDCEAMRSGDYF